jgi:glycosyltransferase involved in cell wall biosynthesis
MPPAFVARILIFANTTWNLVNFRSGLIRALVADGHEVLACAPTDGWVPALEALGCRHCPVPMDQQGTHPWRDALLLGRLLRLMWRERPQLLLGFTVKPNVYGSIAARWCSLMGHRVAVINNVAGLGATFIQPSWVTWVVKRLYRLALRGSSTVFFQNTDDRELFLRHALAMHSQCALLPGSGVDLQRYSPAALPVPKEDGLFRFLMVSRLLWDKGMGELVEAARLLRQARPQVRVQVLGFLDVQNPSAVDRLQVLQWQADGLIEYLGSSDDPRAALAQADCVVLPSYREGTPRSMLEAAAMAKPLITTDVPGCRRVVDDGVNGWLCRARDAQDLAAKMQAMVDLPAPARAAMGQAGRLKMEREFDERRVLEQYRSAISAALGQPHAAALAQEPRT